MPDETVFKYPIGNDGLTFMNIPADASVIHVAEQRGVPCLWVRLNTVAPRVHRQFRWVGTGLNPSIKPHWPHVGSLLMNEGSLVLHVFEETPEPHNATVPSFHSIAEVPHD